MSSWYGIVIEYKVLVVGGAYKSTLFSSDHGIPNPLGHENNCACTHPSLISTLDDAVVSYESSGGNFSATTLFGTNPLSGSA